MVHNKSTKWKNATRSLLLLLLFLSWFNVRAQDNPAMAQRVEWLQSHVVQLNSIDPADEDFSDLKLFKEMIGKAKVVLLGEQSHGDGATFHAKTRLIKFLHQQCGFDVIAFESGLYDCKKGWEQIRDGRPVPEAVAGSVFGIWTKSKAFAPLISYLETAKNTPRPLELAGFDCQFTGANSRDFLLSDVEAFLKSKGVEAEAIDGWPEFRSMFGLLVSGGYRKKAPEAAAEERFITALEAIEKKLPGDSTRESRFWRQLVRSLRSEARGNFRLARIGEQNMTMADSQYRDTQMGENIAWLSNMYYPNRKIIVWAASRHNAYALQDVETHNDSFTYKGFINMGDIVREKLGDAAYNLGFTAYDGIAGPWSAYSNALEPPSPGSLEALFARTGFDHFILDFKNIPAGGEWLREPRIARPFGYAEMTARWPAVFDGLCFTKTMFPSETVEQLPGSGLFHQSVEAAPYRGREVLYRVRMKAEMKEKSMGNLWLRVDLEPGKTGFYKTHVDKPITLNEWAAYEIRGKVDETARQINLGIVFSGDGLLWADDVSLSYLNDAGQWQPIPLENPGFETSPEPGRPYALPGWRVNLRPASISWKATDAGAAKGNKCLLIEYERKTKEG